MPVKNVKRKTNDGFEGVITGLNDKEKEIIASSVDNVEANPTDEATETLSKLKVGNTTYGVETSEYISGKELTFFVDTGVARLYTITLSSEERTKILSGNVKGISCTLDEDGTTSTYSLNLVNLNNGKIAIFVATSAYPSFMEFLQGQIAQTEDESYFIRVRSLNVSQLPSDASSKTYMLKAVNGTLTWDSTAMASEDYVNTAINSAITSTLEANY